MLFPLRSVEPAKVFLQKLMIQTWRARGFSEGADLGEKEKRVRFPADLIRPPA